MGKHYTQIKDRLGIDEILADSSEDETDPYISKFITLIFIYFVVKAKGQKKEYRRLA